MKFSRNNKRLGKKKTRKICFGVVHITATFNNTIVTFSDVEGNVVCGCSAGAAKFKHCRKSTPYAAQVAASIAAKKATAIGIKSVNIRISGPGPGRESALRAIEASGLDITTMKDTTPIPHNGCRPPKRRRI